MSEWGTKRDGTPYTKEERYERNRNQARIARDAFVNNAISLIQIARMVRFYGAETDCEIDYMDSIDIARKLSDGRHE